MNTLPAHVMVEMCFGKRRKRGFIAEDNMHPKRLEALLESYGVFKGCEDLASLISSKVEKRVILGDFKNFEIVPTNCDFIERIEVGWTDGEGASYHTNSELNKNFKYDPLRLSVGKNITLSDGIYALMVHELTHAYEDYMRRRSNIQGLWQYATKIGYGKNGESAMKDGVLQKEIAEIFYFFANFERNAYVAQMTALMDSCDMEFKSANDALKWFKTTFPYKRYVTIFKSCELLCNLRSKDARTTVVNYANHYSEQKFKTYQSFRKWLAKKAYKCQRKIDRIVPIIAARKLKITEGLLCANTPLYYESGMTIEEMLREWERL